MNNKKKELKTSYAGRKRFLLIVHALALCLFVAGVSIVYCNANFKKGIQWLNSEIYEESPAFDALFESEATELMRYVRYRDVFEYGGELDTDNEIFAYSTGSGEEIIWTVNDVLDYAKLHGYSFDNDYRVLHSETAEDNAQAEAYPVTWRAYRETEKASGPGTAFVTLDAMTREVMTALGDYCRSVDRYNKGNSNLYYLIELEGRKAYTNRADLTEELARSLGKYVILSSESPLPDNNLSETPVRIRDMLLEEGGSRDTDYRAIFAVDTGYPLRDDFYTGVLNYASQRDVYAAGLLLMLTGFLTMLVSLARLFMLAGRTKPKSSELQLMSFDRRMPELNILNTLLLIGFLIFVSDNTIARLIHILAPERYWTFSGEMLVYIIIYLCAFPLVFSLLRAWKAGILWEKSFAKQLAENAREFSLNITFARRIAVYYSAFVAANIALTAAISSLILARNSVSARLLAFTLFLLLAVTDIWFFQKLYRKRIERDRIAEAIGQLDSGSAGEEALLDTSEFHGREARLADTINNISAGLKRALNDQVRSERMKAELITNVSHDIKTPLTSIINYVDLIKRAHPADPKILEYVNVLEQKSQHLKTLTEDLVEASKASTGNVPLNAVDINFVELIEQTNGEFEERFTERNLSLVSELPRELILIHADGQHLWRVLENLYNNAFKYAAEGSRIYVNVVRAGGRVKFTIKNISARPLNISPEELTERFVRGDDSRTTDGSGLGLSIAKSLTELQHGSFDIVIDGDYFKASIGFDIVSS